MKAAVCTFCQNAAPRLFRAKDLNRRISEDVFTYYRCPECRLVFLSPHPVDLGKYYPDNFHTIPTSIREAEEASRVEAYKIPIVQDHVKSGRVLEIGSSYGGFAYLAKQAGFEVDVIEMDARCCQFLTDIVGVRAINETDPVKALEQLGTYDVIALWQVIEHLPEPWTTLRALAQHLNPKGILILAAPNPDSLQFQLLGRRWPHLDAPRHLSIIPVSLLRTLGDQLRIKLISESTNDGGCLHWNNFGWQVFLSKLVPGHRAKLWMRRLGDIVTRLVSPYETQPLRGSTYTLVFQRIEE